MRWGAICVGVDMGENHKSNVNGKMEKNGGGLKGDVQQPSRVPSKAKCVVWKIARRGAVCCKKADPSDREPMSSQLRLG